MWVTDGTYLYMRGPERGSDQFLFEYTLMPSDMKTSVSADKLKKAQLVSAPFSYTKGCPMLKMPSGVWQGRSEECYQRCLFDLQNDRRQQHPFRDSEIEKRMCKLLIGLMEENEAPEEQFVRFGLERN